MDQKNGDMHESEMSAGAIQRAYLNILEDMQAEKRSSDEQRSAILNILDDATDMQARLKLAERSHVQDLVASMSDAVILFDQDKRIVVLNPAMRRIIGNADIGVDSDLDAFLSCCASEGPSPASSEGQRPGQAQIRNAMRETEATRMTAHIDSFKLKGHIYEVFVTPVGDARGESFGGAIIFHDITHLKEVDQMKTDFVALASHQLRTPLTSVNWYIESLLRGDAGVLGDGQKRLLEEVYTGIKRMERLVDDLLNVSRLEAGRLTIAPVSTVLVPFIADIIREVEPMAQARSCVISFEKPADESLAANVDPQLLRQVIHNLLTNAIKYSSKDTGAVTVSLATRDARCEVRVSDSGIGIPQDAQDKIFEKFYRATNAQETESEGSGLGLYLAKMIMESSGGSLAFESPIARRIENGVEVGYGTTFLAAFPMSGMKSRDGDRNFIGQQEKHP